MGVPSNRPMATATAKPATALNATLQGLTGAEKAGRLIAAGYVTSRGTAAWTAFYEAVLAERGDQPERDDRVDLMLHYVSMYAGKVDLHLLKLQWETYAEQAEIDEETDTIDAFIEEHGIQNLGFYSDWADMMNDYPSYAVDAFIRHFGISEIGDFRDAYLGQYRSGAAFAEEYLQDSGMVDLPDYVIVDWQATWDSSLYYDYIHDEESEAMFASNW